MKVIQPVKITDANFVSSDVAEADQPAYSGGATYAKGALVIRTTTHRIYESLVAGNVGNTPELNPDKWLDIGPTNRWSMFDNRIGTDTVRVSDLTVKIQPGLIDSLALLDTDAESADVEMKVGATTVYSGSRSFNAAGVPITDWYTYFFAELGRKNSVLFDDLPPYPSAVTSVHVIGGGAVTNVSVGTLIVGRSADVGSAEQGAEVGIVDYSRKTTDDFGVTSITQRAFSKRMTIRTMFNGDQIDAMQRLLAGLRATPALWIGADGVDALMIYGFYKDFSIDLAYSNVNYCSLTIEGLT